MFGSRKNETEEATANVGIRSGQARPAPEPGDGDPSEAQGAEQRSPGLTISLPAGRARPTPRPANQLTDPISPASPGDQDGRRLVVGRSISLSGTIKSCEKLVVEGFVETDSDDCRELEVARTGTYKGNAEVEMADIAGIFEGSLTSRGVLIIRSSGRVEGAIAYGQLEIERGATLIGSAQPIAAEDSRAAAPALAVELSAG